MEHDISSLARRHWISAQQFSERIGDVVGGLLSLPSHAAQQTKSSPSAFSAYGGVDSTGEFNEHHSAGSVLPCPHETLRVWVVPRIGSLDTVENQLDASYPRWRLGRDCELHMRPPRGLISVKALCKDTRLIEKSKKIRVKGRGSRGNPFPPFTHDSAVQGLVHERPQLAGRSPHGVKLRHINIRTVGTKRLLNPYLRANQPAAELAAIERNIEWMGSACTLSITVSSADFDLSAYAALISRFRLNNAIRVSLAHPMADHENTFAAKEDFHRIGTALKCQGRSLRQCGIGLFCDCGFVACMFAETRQEPAIRAGLAGLAECGILFRSLCNPLPDVHPDLSASHCLPLASRKRLTYRRRRQDRGPRASLSWAPISGRKPQDLSFPNAKNALSG
jgi:hypothetical protein